MLAVISICLNLSVEKYKNPLKAGFYVVELEGIEPSSKQETDMLSTCLVCPWLSGAGWQQTADLYLSSFIFAGKSERFPN